MKQGEMFSDLALENQQQKMEEVLLRITPENVKTLKENEIFVFGSNLAGIHGAGAAKLAYDKRWAEYRKGYGIYWAESYPNNPQPKMTGSYAIPTKGLYIETIPLSWIEYYVKHFIEYAEKFSTLKFLVTEIGCGLAGYTPEEIAPMFKDAVNLENVYLPKRFWNILNKTN